MTAQLTPIIVQPGQAQELHAFGNTLSVFLSGEHTNGTLSVTSEWIPPGRHWIITTPSGFETFFARSADEFAQAGGPDRDKIVAIHREHGIELLEEI